MIPIHRFHRQWLSFGGSVYLIRVRGARRRGDGDVMHCLKKKNLVPFAERTDHREISSSSSGESVLTY